MTEQSTDEQAGAQNCAPEPDDEQAGVQNRTPDPETADEDGDTFPRSYVEQLRRENATYRERAQRADDLARQLHHSRVAATGRLQDPEDLPYDDAHLDDQPALEAAIDELLARKPYLAARHVSGDVGQGQTGSQGVDLAGMLRARA